MFVYISIINQILKMMKTKTHYQNKLENERYGRPQNIRVLVSSYLMELRSTTTETENKKEAVMAE